MFKPTMLDIFSFVSSNDSVRIFKSIAKIVGAGCGDEPEFTETWPVSLSKLIKQPFCPAFSDWLFILLIVVAVRFAGARC